VLVDLSGLPRFNTVDKSVAEGEALPIFFRWEPVGFISIAKAERRIETVEDLSEASGSSCLSAF